MNVTVRSMKLHGGAFGARAATSPFQGRNRERGCRRCPYWCCRVTLDRHINVTCHEFGMPVVVSVNRFASDTDAELHCLIECARAFGRIASVCLTEVHAKGGPGGAAFGKGRRSTACQDHILPQADHSPLFSIQGYAY
ncbi:MAG: formate--tetrahydrofolate ligase [Candidatus Poseidoniaceae archaeon]